MKSFVTGATGFVGCHVVRHLLAAGDSVRVLVRPASNLRALEGQPVDFAEGDLRDGRSLDAALQGIDRVFHVAADYRLWSARPEEMYESNVGGTRNVLQAAQRAGVSRFIYTSTVATIAVWRGDSLPNEETHARVDEMIGHYKRSKFLAEEEAMKAASAGFPVVIVNPTTPVGALDWKPTPTGRIVVDFLNGRMPAYVDTGLNMVAVDDVAAGHLLAAERGRSGGRYILGARNMTLQEILQALAQITGRPAPWVRLPHFVALAAAHLDEWISRARGRVPQIPVEGVKISRHRMFVDGSKATRELGYRPGPVEAALAQAVEWYEANGYVKAPHRRLVHATAA
ncbi:MAG: hopanoid-associated sugar epimerase [Candidatus Acidiferrales bacterium]|jgi:dihydroflavonol-4-reductase